MEQDYVQADNRNLPKINAFMVANFFRNNPDFYAAELKNVKTTVSARNTYGDDAIGYVQLLREDNLCLVKCKMCPEHKVKSKGYNLTLTVNEQDEVIVSCKCHDCAASAGGCKHAVAFLMWAHRRSEDPASTSVECYWKKPTLSRVGTTLKAITVQELCNKKKLPSHLNTSSTLLTDFKEEAKKRKVSNCELLKYEEDFQHSGVLQYSLHHFIMGQSIQNRNDVNKLIDIMKTNFNETAIHSIEESTRLQNKSKLWYELRYGRITASKAHEVSVCQTPDGCLVAAILGAKIPDNAAMQRGRNLERSVRRTLGTKLKCKIKPCGLFVSQQHPMIAASPDGLCKDGTIVEIKCPTTNKTKKNYIKNGTITDKCNAQVQLQMYTTGTKQCYFCVAGIDFEESQNIEIILVPYDKEYTTNLINKLVSFWIVNIYPILYRSTT